MKNMILSVTLLLYKIIASDYFYSTFLLSLQNKSTKESHHSRDDRYLSASSAAFDPLPAATTA